MLLNLFLNLSNISSITNAKKLLVSHPHTYTSICFLTLIHLVFQLQIKANMAVR